MSTPRKTEYSDHELVVFANDKPTHLRCIIAIHDTTLGPATGGTRYAFYRTPEDGLTDALKLSQAMTYKCALAGVPLGGGKAVIFAEAKHPKNEKMLEAFAKKINLLNGNFTTGEDVGITHEDLRVLFKNSPYVNGRKAGDLGPWAARGVFYAIKGALRQIFGSDSLSGKSFAIKGLGKVGSNLAGLLLEAGAIVYGSDIDPSVATRIKNQLPNLIIIPSTKIHAKKVDVYCPCALGNDITIEKAPSFRCRIICGGANNQLASPETGTWLFRHGIIYIPDYVANAGGLINVAGELLDKPRAWVEERTKRIQNTVEQLIKTVRRLNQPPEEVANALAKKILLAKKQKQQVTI